MTSPSDQDMLTELRILSSIVENDRIATNCSVRPRIRIQKPSLFRGLNRLINSESRNNNVIFIQSLLNSVIEKYNGALSQNNVNLANRIKQETVSAINGLSKLQKTYEDDLQFQACINVQIETIKIHLEIDTIENDE